MNRTSGAALEQVGRQVEELVPNYYIQQLDPIEALDTGVGNCFAKAMVACGILVVRHNVEPAVAYSHRLHGTEKASSKPMDFRTKKNMAHIAVVTANSRAASPYDVLALDYGVEIGSSDAADMRFKKQDKAMIEPYNKHENFIEIVDDGAELVVTPEASNMGLTVVNWREGSEIYLNTLDREVFSIDELLSQIETRTHGSAA